MKIWTSAKSPKAVEYSMTYGLIVCVESLGIFLESIFCEGASGRRKHADSHGGVGFILYRRWVKKSLPAKIEQ